jgi:hypothetical protein
MLEFLINSIGFGIRIVQGHGVGVAAGAVLVSLKGRSSVVRGRNVLWEQIAKEVRKYITSTSAERIRPCLLG